jgi:nucleoside-diphosphate-sugar epimerase
MSCLVTGAAGFIGSHLCRRLLKEKISVVGIDSLTDFYPSWIKKKNILPLLKEKKFKFIAKDINELNLKELLEKTDCVLHLAAQAGVRASWAQNFSVYTKNNIEATQKILEVSKNSHLKKLVYASSSSVYGLCPELPMSEISPLHPYSPYGVTKLAGEQLCFLYHKNYGVPAISLRLFTVYGPGQRPDMAFHKFFRAIANNKKITVYGDGKQTRDFTFIDDVVEAHIAALQQGKVGETYNVGGGVRKKLEDIFPIIEDTCQRKIEMKKEGIQKGDVLHTFSDIDKARRDLNYSPQTALEDGLKEEWQWIQKLYS